MLLRPENTKDPVNFPLGYVPIHGNEPVDVMYGMLKNGFFLAPAKKIEDVHNLFLGVTSLCRSEFPVIKFGDVQKSHAKLLEIESRILIRRDFWILDDFNDPELNKSFGVQNLYFDNYKWSQVLWRRFQIFVEEYFPLADHSHLTYTEYINLIKSFSHFEQGTHAQPVLPRSVLLHPPFGVTVPSSFSLEPLELYKRWLTNFRSPFSINKVLVLNGGSGVAAFCTKLCGVQMVQCVDPRPRSISHCRRDARNNKTFSSIRFQVTEFVPPKEETDKKFDMVFLYPDEDILSNFSSSGSSIFAPGENGYAGKLEEYFDKVADLLSDTGVAVICCSNLHSLLNMNKPNPIEYEVKVNRRFVILDYYDIPLHSKGSIKVNSLEPKIDNYSVIRSKLRSELWVLHKLESIEHFGFIHGIPGAKPPSVKRQWRGKITTKQRQQVLKNHVELMGGNWENYKERFLQMLRENANEEEDDVAEVVRMSLDPSYPQELARRAKERIESNQNEKRLFHEEVKAKFRDVPPRQVFDDKYKN